MPKCDKGGKIFLFFSRMKQLSFLLFFLCFFTFNQPLLQAQTTGNAGGSSQDATVAPASTTNPLEELVAFAKAENLNLGEADVKRVLEGFDGNVDFSKRVLLSTKEIVEGKTLKEVAEKLKLPADPAEASLTPYQTRVWYSWRKSLIGSLVDRSQGPEQAARNALNMRNEIRTKARLSMKDTDIADFLNEKELNMTWEQAFEKYKGNYEDIISASMRGRGGVDTLFKIPKDK